MRTLNSWLTIGIQCWMGILSAKFTHLLVEYVGLWSQCRYALYEQNFTDFGFNLNSCRIPQHIWQFVCRGLLLVYCGDKKISLGRIGHKKDKIYWRLFYNDVIAGDNEHTQGILECLFSKCYRCTFVHLHWMSAAIFWLTCRKIL